MTKINFNLNVAKEVIYDEFYTTPKEVEEEIKHYGDFFRGKKVLCNCNDNALSAFFIVFSRKFDELGLKQLVCTSYNPKGKGMKYVDGQWVELKGDGGFESNECIELLENCDVVVTAPPFSKFSGFVSLLVHYRKKFLIIGSVQAISYNNIFPLIKERKMWVWDADYSYVEFPTSKKKTTTTFVNISWFTNIPNDKYTYPLHLCNKYKPDENLKYDNYDAINVNEVYKIPMDYNGIMGVPITFMTKHCPSQFEIVDKLDSPKINGKNIFKRILIRRTA